MSANPAPERVLRLLSFNIQAGSDTHAYREYLTRGWRSVLPHRGKLANLARIAALARPFDLVALQEVDGRSLRSGFRHQLRLLAESADFPYWSHQPNRRLALAEPGNGVLSRFAPSSVLDHRLPGRIPGRGTLEVRFGEDDAALRVFIVHLALTPRARLRQAAYLAEQIGNAVHVIVLGDFNCEPDCPSIAPLIERTQLRLAGRAPSFPSWRPSRCIDLVLTTRALTVLRYGVLPLRVSDHLPVAVEVLLPSACILPRTKRGEP